MVPHFSSGQQIPVTISSVGRAGLHVTINDTLEGFIYFTETGIDLGAQGEKEMKELLEKHFQPDHDKSYQAWVLDYNPDTARLALTLRQPAPALAPGHQARFPIRER